jgi:hypothetical protein
MNVDRGMEFVVGEEPADPAASWDRYVSGVSRMLGARGHRPGGVDAVVHSTVPIGGGLSSSASLEVACALMFQAAGVPALSHAGQTNIRILPKRPGERAATDSRCGHPMNFDRIARMAVYLRQIGAGAKERALVFGDNARKLLKIG